jgi:hypothetical protein
MDIEGSEAAAVIGAKNLIARSPSLSIIQEWSAVMMLHHTNMVEYVKFWSNLGYSFAKIHCNKFREISDEQLLLEKDLCDILISKDLKSINSHGNNS